MNWLKCHKCDFTEFEWDGEGAEQLKDMLKYPNYLKREEVRQTILADKLAQTFLVDHKYHKRTPVPVREFEGTERCTRFGARLD